MSSAPGWVPAVSKKTGGRYYFNAATNRSLWHDDTLPLKWAWEMAGPEAPRVYVNMVTGEHTTLRPSYTLEAPEAAPQTGPSEGGAPAPGRDPGRAVFSELLLLINAGDDDVSIGECLSRASPTAAAAALVTCTEEKLPATALGLAAKLGRSRIVSALLRRHGAPVNARAEHSGYTALSLAAHSGHALIVKQLLDAGADPLAMNRWNETSLRVAEKRGHTVVVKLLQEALMRPGGTGAASAAVLARLTAATAVTTDKGVRITLRGVRREDQAALVHLYCACQAEYRGADGSTEAVTHDRWAERILATDFKDAAAHYGSVPRGALWVATTTRAEFEARSGGVPPEKELLLADDVSRSLSGSGSQEVLVGCVALVPWNYASEAAAAAGGAGDAAASEEEKEDAGELQRMCAHSGLRRSGIASALIALVERSAAALGYTHVRLTTLVSMPPAVGLYSSRGYTQQGPVTGSPIEFHGHTIYRTEFAKRVAPQPLLLHAAAKAPSAGSSAATAPVPADPRSSPAAEGLQLLPAAEPPPILPHGATYVPQPEVDAALAAGAAATHALALSVARRITSGDIPFPYKRRFTDPAHPAAWFADLRGLPCALDVVAGARYALHGFLDRGRSVVVRVAAYAPAAAGSSGGAITVRRARIAADGPLRLDLSATSPLGGAAPSTSLPPPPPPPLSVTSFAGCGPVRKPFDRAFNERGGLLVDFYSEPARMRARRRDQALAPVDAWREPPAALAIAAKALRKFRAVTDDSLRHGQYGVLNACNLFHANLARALFGLFCARRVLDPCAGWGDRLMGAMATPSVTRYVASDPNPGLAAPHAAMIHAHAAAGGGAYAVFPVPFEDLVLPAADSALGFDLVLTSPPYFDLELYTPPASAPAPAPAAAPAAAAAAAAATTPAAALQSTDRHPAQRDWLQEWYFPALAKAWGCLQPGGHMAIYINDHAAKAAPQQPQPQQPFEDIDVCLPMLQFAAERLPGCLWVGVLGIEGETGQVRPLWVWRREGGQEDAAGLPPIYALAAAASAGGAAGGAAGGGAAAHAVPGSKRRWNET